MKLEQLISQGATITFFGDLSGSTPLAAAAWRAGVLWFCDLWPENEFAAHHMHGTLVEHNGMFILHTNGQAAAVIAAMDPDEREQFLWQEWGGQDMRAAEMRSFAEALRKNFLES